MPDANATSTNNTSEADRTFPSWKEQLLWALLGAVLGNLTAAPVDGLKAWVNEHVIYSDGAPPRSGK